MSDFKPFDNQLAGLLAALSPAGRRRLAGEIAKQLRTAQQQRIKQQKAPDGSPYQARKRQPLRAKKGRIKRAMFQKLRTNRYMKASGRENGAVVEFTGNVQRIARVHQYGLKDRPNAHAQEVQYAQRQLLGLNEINIKEIELLIGEHISN
ncbi:TPA: phage virion morphogenesis protein [Enterobacter hormaechei subsp. xiangfangensis]|uniref:phage virion morphogenesis protein n=1 Tax=Enterobacter hormaechei TaxID=158836 RepID=UPI000C9CB2D0|nr:phage virion morphogenesis protein [Enterobacter hormaechei]HCJ7311853.1 phage virion morphogenesis protein [Enterobacter hormaechei subsp. xiangfangensis]MCM7604290.1 phage virion morphogenesis protein [Enterobacter hormaechei]MEC6221583.1 phage virion morphogenesis protein [Enterobacter hormaechei]HAT7658737.1 phage virion morphogenesis protein [Enterobacter hormaechei]HCJ7628439.1 phage virion morphogenesis protein [Enterobacter hormaechei subsp. xiangfangensis]